MIICYRGGMYSAALQYSSTIYRAILLGSTGLLRQEVAWRDGRDGDETLKATVGLHLCGNANSGAGAVITRY